MPILGCTERHVEPLPLSGAQRSRRQSPINVPIQDASITLLARALRARSYQDNLQRTRVRSRQLFREFVELAATRRRLAYLSIITSVDLTTAVTLSPTLSASRSAEMRG